MGVGTADEAAVVGVDIGGTKVALGIAPLGGGEPWQTARIETTSLPAGEAVLDRLAFEVRSLTEQAGRSWASVRAVGVGSPGPFRRGRHLFQPANLPGWDGLDLEGGLAARLGRPVRVENDANAAAWAEWTEGAGRGSRNLVYVTVSTGIGAGLVLDGRLYEGADGNAGEIGHWVLEPDGPLCHCGRHGCLETLASGTALARMAGERRNESPYLTAVSHPTAREVLAGWEAGDAVCTGIVNQAAYHLGWGLALAVNAFNPDRIVLGGGVILGSGRLLEPVQAWVERLSLPALFAAVTIREAGLGPESGLAGALAVARLLG